MNGHDDTEILGMIVVDIKEFGSRQRRRVVENSAQDSINRRWSG